MSDTANDTQESTAPSAESALPQTRGVIAVSARTAIVMLLFTLIFTALMAGTYTLTREPITASENAAKHAQIAGVLPAGSYDNDLLASAFTLPATPALGQGAPTTAYRAMKNGLPVAIVVEVAAPDGYSGRIDLITAIAPNGDMLAARVTRHKETPGLGDYIDIAKDKQKERPWITQFNTLGPSQVDEAQWRVKKDGGRFDQRAGATISARAVTLALGRAARHIAQHSDEFFAEQQP